MSNPSLVEKADGKFLVVDKPPNLLSHETTAVVGRLFCIKAGHSGTLDPNVSGVLIIGLGKATRLLRFLTELPKEYVGIVKFPRRMKKGEVEQIFESLKGEITQTPPEKSAVVKKPRKRRVYELEALEIEKERVLFRARVEKGTYIRVLCEQMGGVMEDLRRTESGGIGEEEATIMQRILDGVNLAKDGDWTLLEEMLWEPKKMFERSSIPKVRVGLRAEENLKKGAPLYFPGIVEVEGTIKEGQHFAVFGSGGNFIGVAKAFVDFAGQDRGKFAKMERVHLY